VPFWDWRKISGARRECSLSHKKLRGNTLQGLQDKSHQANVLQDARQTYVYIPH
jgi:hypothetical protein